MWEIRFIGSEIFKNYSKSMKIYDNQFKILRFIILINKMNDLDKECPLQELEEIKVVDGAHKNAISVYGDAPNFYTYLAVRVLVCK